MGTQGIVPAARKDDWVGSDLVSGADLLRAMNEDRDDDFLHVISRYAHYFPFKRNAYRSSPCKGHHCYFRGPMSAFAHIAYNLKVSFTAC